MKHVATALVVVLLLASVYFGLANADDIANTITIGQRLVGISAAAYGIVALFALYALWRRRLWLALCLTVWACLVALTGTLATAVYGDSPWATASAALLTTLIVAPVVVYGWRRRARIQSTNQAASA